MKLYFGTGGVPLTSAKSDTESGIRRIAELGLDNMELEFVRGVRMTPEKAMAVRAVKEETGVKLTVHGPYYVNLASDKNSTFYGSIGYITNSVLIGGLAGAESVTFHPGFYQKLSAAETYERVANGLTKIYAEFQTKKFNDHPVLRNEIAVAPELTGKASQFGDLEELVGMCKQFEGQNLRFCFDFAHKYARSVGKFNTYDEYMQMLEYIASNLGQTFLEKMHIHVSAIMYSDKGERNHVTMLDSVDAYHDAGVNVDGDEKIMAGLTKVSKNGGSEFNWRDLLKALKKMNVGGVVVCESPNLEMDALLMKKTFQSL